MDSVVHFELPFEDQARAEKFYQDVFGWKTMSMPGMGYVMAYSAEVDEQHMTKESGRINGGMFQRQEPFKGPVIILNVEDLDAKLEQVASHGGQIIRGKQTVGDMGWVAYVNDSENNLIGIWESAKK